MIFALTSLGFDIFARGFCGCREGGVLMFPVTVTFSQFEFARSVLQTGTRLGGLHQLLLVHAGSNIVQQASSKILKCLSSSRWLMHETVVHLWSLRRRRELALGQFETKLAGCRCACSLPCEDTSVELLLLEPFPLLMLISVRGLVPTKTDHHALAADRHVKFLKKNDKVRCHSDASGHAMEVQAWNSSLSAMPVSAGCLMSA